MIRKATLQDVDIVLQLINIHAESGEVLYRTREEVEAHIADFRVIESDGAIVGTCGLSWDMGGMVEIRSLAVHPDHYRQGVGTELVKQCIHEATLAEYPRIFVLTYAMPLFEKLGFQVIHKSELPQKIWKDCQGCRKQEHCDEIAMIRDLVPVSMEESGTADSTEESTVVPA